MGTRLAGARGIELVDLAGATLRSVARGILGVALIQSLLAGAGFLAAGVPGAGLWVLLCLLLAIVQLPPGLVLIPVAIYVLSTAGTVTGVLFLIWSIFVSILDNFLKPLLLGRGLEVPMLVIFVGAIGGFLASGFLGLFVGSIVLAIGYELLVSWLELRKVFDFERIRILDATDLEVEELAIQVGNDPEVERRQRTRELPVEVALGCELSANTLKILEKTFGQVIPFAPPAR